MLFRKLTTYLALIALILFPFRVDASLWEFWQKRGQEFIPCNQERFDLAAEYAVFDYDCSKEKNDILEARMLDHERRLEGNIGASVATGYKSTLQSSMSSTQTTVPVSSLDLPDGTTLTMDALDDKVFLVLEPGGSKQEIVVCTSISSSQFAGCTRGLSFSGTSESAVSANKKTHRAGSRVVMSNTHYVFEQLVDKDQAETLDGSYTFTSTTPVNFYTFPIVSSTGFTGLPTNNGHVPTKYYVDNVGAGGFTSVNASSTKGLEVYGTSPETVGVNVSTTLGYGFSSDGSVYRMVSSTGGIEADSQGLYVDGTDDFEFSGTNSYSGSHTFATNTLFYGSGSASSTPDVHTIPVTNASSTLEDGFLGLTNQGDIPYSDGTNIVRLASGTEGYVLKQGTTVPEWGTAIFGATTTDSLQLSADTTRTETSNSYQKKKEIRVNFSGYYRVKFDLAEVENGADKGSDNAYGRIYRNGSAYGTERTEDTSTPVTFSEDLYFGAGDLIQIYARGSSTGETASVSNFQIYFDIVEITEGEVITD